MADHDDEADPTELPLVGLRVVVTRPDTGSLDTELAGLGASVVSAPTITFASPSDGGEALRRAVAAIGSYDWIIVSSATAADALDAAGLDAARLAGVRVAVIGPATAGALEDRGVAVDLVPPTAVAESLVEVFPPGPGRVLRVRPEVARDVIALALRARGWQVDEVVAYRTVPLDLDESTVTAIRAADVAVFTSPSTVDALVAASGVAGLPGTVVSIGPVTTAALRGHGISPTAEADPHTVAGLVAAVVAATRTTGG